MPTTFLTHKAPRTRKELVTYLWDNKIWVDICKEGPFYILQYETWMCQTYIRRIDDLNFEEWGTYAKNKILEIETCRKWNCSA